MDLKSNGKCSLPKTLELWIEMQWKVKGVSAYGCWSAEVNLFALICKINKREGNFLLKSSKIILVAYTKGF